MAGGGDRVGIGEGYALGDTGEWSGLMTGILGMVDARDMAGGTGVVEISFVAVVTKSISDSLGIEDRPDAERGIVSGAVDSVGGSASGAWPMELDPATAITGT